jgi:hypothetical protein
MQRSNITLKKVFVLLLVFCLIFTSTSSVLANDSETALRQGVDNLFFERAEYIIGYKTNLNKFYSMDSKLLQFELNDRVQKFRDLERQWETKIVSMKSTPYIKRVNINGGVASVSVYEWTLFDWTWQGNIITSGFGVNHDMTWSFKDSSWIVLKDSYDEGPLTGVRSPDYISPPLINKSRKEPSIQTNSSNLIYTPTTTYTYNRNAAATYADQHWNLDNYNDSYYARGYNENGQLADCANFVSQAMHTGAAPYVNWLINNSSSWWYNNNGTFPNMTYDDSQTSTWGNVDYQYPFMLNHFGTEIPISNVTQGGLVKGDIVYYDWDGVKGVNHVTIVAYVYVDYTGGTTLPLVDSHTNDYYHIRWDYGDPAIIHPIHISNSLAGD